MSFNFQNQNYTQSQATNTGNHELGQTVENGGLFTRDECRNLAR